MHVNIIVLEEIKNPLTKDQIKELKHNEGMLWSLDNCNSAFFDYFEEGTKETALDNPEFLCKFYENNLFELVQKNEGINHIYKVKKDAKVNIGKIKLKNLKKELEKTTPENFQSKYKNLLCNIVDNYETYIVQNYAFYPIDNWVFDVAQEEKSYQVIQVFDAHI